MSKAKSLALTFLRTIGLPTLAALILLVLWLVPQWQLSSKKLSSPDKQAEMENAYRATLVQALGGAFFFVTAYFTYRNVKATEANVRATEDKQVTERFSKAIELFGSEELKVRLGGIYALERIAKDSEKDYWTIMEVLTAYVREKKPWDSDDTMLMLYDGFRSPDLDENLDGELYDEEAEETEKRKHRIPTDLQAVLTIIGRRVEVNGKDEKRRLDLSRTNLRNAELIGDGFKKVDFSEANFFWTYLREAQFQGADLSFCNLRGADLTKANLEGANFSEANLSVANLEGADLSLANLEEADLRGAKLGKADLRGAKLGEANLREAILNEADLYKANLSGASLYKANLSGASLYKADLSGASLYKANLSGADLTGAIDLTFEQISEATTDEKTKLPDYLQTPKPEPPEPPKP